MSQRYGYDEFSEWELAEEKVEQQTAAFSDAETEVNLGAFRLSRRILELIENGWNRESEYKSRSEADQAVIHALLYVGASDDEIRSIFRTYPIGEKYREPGNGDRYLGRSVARGKEHVKRKEEPRTTAENQDTRADAIAEVNCTDLGNAKRFVARHVGNVLYSAERKKWCIWNGKHWQWDTTGAIYDYAEEVIRQIAIEAANAPNQDKRDSLLNHALKSESRGRIEAMLALAQSLPEIRTTLDRFDRGLYLFNCPNVTIDLRTGEGREHRREDFITRMCPTRFVQTAPCPVFENFLGDVTEHDDEIQAFIQRLSGMSLTGDISEHAAIMATGSGWNGKSTLINLLGDVMGKDYAKEIKAEVLMESRDNKDYHLAELVGVRMLIALESERNRRFSVALVKAITGGDRIVCCRKYEHPFSFLPEFKLWFGTNHKPRIDDTTNSIWNRLKPIPFNAYFAPDNPATDKDLPQKLRAEAEGILAWMVRGCLAWKRDGLHTPEKVKLATEDYRDDQNVIGAFINDRCVKDPKATETMADLYGAYVKWCLDTGEKPETQRGFGNLLTEAGLPADRIKNARIRRGLRLVDAQQTGDGDAW